MGSAPAELSMDLRIRPTFVPKTITDFLCHLSTIPNASHKLSTLHDFLSSLELELTKIDPFKRELPLCMLVLNDAISALKVESAKCNAHKPEPVLEEFIPLKKECDEGDESEKEKECRDKRNWMSSVQLWSTTTSNNNYAACGYDYERDKKPNYELENKKNDEEERQYVAEDLFQYGRNRNGTRGFVMPYKSYSSTKEEKEDSVINGLCLLTPRTVMKNSREGSGSSGSRASSSHAVSSSPPSMPRHRTGRKQRRCWSPELHRRFVKALEELGGSQAATPKQIRDLMQVDGLTNDEVKSHLQKYRLHTRRVPPIKAATANQSVVILGRLRMSQAQCNDFSKGIDSGSGSGSGSPQGPLQLAAGPGEGTSPTDDDNTVDDEDEKSELEKSHVQSWKR